MGPSLDNIFGEAPAGGTTAPAVSSNPSLDNIFGSPSAAAPKEAKISASALPKAAPVASPDTSSMFSKFLGFNNMKSLSTTTSGSTPSTVTPPSDNSALGIARNTFKGLPEAAAGVSKAANETVIGKPAELLGNTKFIQEAAAGTDQGGVGGNFGQDLLRRLSYGLESFSGLSGGLYQAPANPTQDFTDKAVKTLSHGLGMAVGISSLGSVVGAVPGVARAVQGLSGLASSLPLVGKYIAPFITPLVENTAGFAIHGQLDPNLADDLHARALKLGEAIATAPIYTALGAIRNAGISIPLSFGLGYGMAKLSGASNQDALASGMAFSLLDVAGRAKGDRGLTAEDINQKMEKEALSVLNRYAESKLTRDSSPEEFKKAYYAAAHQTHPDVGGDDKSFEAVKNAYDLLSKGAVSRSVESGKPTEAEESVKALSTDIKDGIEEHGPMVTHQALQEHLGVDSMTADKLIQGSKVGQKVPTLAKPEPVAPKEGPAANTDILIEEAKKYKNAEEFIDSQPTYYHSTSAEAAKSIEQNGFKAQIGERSLGIANAKGTWLYESKEPTTEFGKNFARTGKNPAIIETKVNGKVFDATSDERSIRAVVEDKSLITKLRSEGYVGVKGDELGTSATFIFDTNAIKTKSQLTSLYEQATKGNRSTQGGFVNPTAAAEDVARVAEKASKYIEQTSKNIEAAKDLDETLYKTQRNIEADVIENNRLLKEVKAIPQEDRQHIDMYRDALEAGLVPPDLTPREKMINDKIIDPLLRDVSKKRAFIKQNGIELSGETYNPRLVKGKGGVIDRIVEAKNNLISKKGTGKRSALSKSASSLKNRTYRALTDKNGKRIVVSQKGGRLTAFNKRVLTDLGRKNRISREKLMKEEIAPLQEKIKRTQRLMDVLESVRTRNPVSDKKLSNLETRIAALKQYSKERGEETAAQTGIHKAFDKEIEKTNAKINTLEARLKALQKFGDIPQIAKEIATLSKDIDSAYEHETNLSLSDIYEKLSDFAERKDLEDEKISKDLAKATAEFKTLSKIPKAESVVLTKSRLKNAQTRMLKLVNELADIEAKYNPDELNERVFVDKDGNVYNVGEATKAEIEEHTSTTYYHDPITAAILTHENITQVYRAVQVLEGFKNAPEFEEIAFKRGEGTPPDGWKLSPLDQFRDYYFEPHTWRVLNAYKNELQNDDPIRALTVLNDFMLHTMFLSPVKHFLNVGVMATVNRGTVAWLNPLAYPTLLKTTIQSIRDVITQSDDLIKTLRAGASLMSTRTSSAERREDILANLGEQVSPSAKAVQTVKKIGGAITPFNWVHAVVWPGTDVFMMQGIREALASQGLTVGTATEEQIASAAENVGKVIPTYRLGVIARQAPNWARRNALVFISWRVSLYRNVYGLGKSFVTGDANFKETLGKDAFKARAKALDRIVMVGFLALIVWPWLRDKWREITNNAAADIANPSILGIISNVNKLVSGQMDIAQFIQTVLDLPPATKEILQQGVNLDLFTGQHIRDINTPFAEQLRETLVHVEKSSTVADQYNKINTGALSPEQFFESLGGLTNPDPVQTKLVGAVTSAETKVNKLDPLTVEHVKEIYDQAKAAGFGTPEADTIVDKLDASDYKIYQDLKAIDQAKLEVELKDKIQPIVEKAYQAGFGTPEAEALVANLSDQELKTYQAIKTILYGPKGTGTPAFNNGPVRNDTSIIGTVAAYANAVRVDPLTAFNRIFTGQRILRTTNGTIIVERNSKLEARMKQQLGGTTEMTLDHIKSFEIGGDNSADNMWLVPKEQAAKDDEVENLLGKALNEGKITGGEARLYELRYKKGADAEEIDARTKRLFDGAGDPLTLEQIKELLQ